MINLIGSEKSESNDLFINACSSSEPEISAQRVLSPQPLHLRVGIFLNVCIASGIGVLIFKGKGAYLGKSPSLLMNARTVAEDAKVIDDMLESAAHAISRPKTTKSKKSSKGNCDRKDTGKGFRSVLSRF